ncbi:maleylpyruvate isomerase family mycothiol-dependent enzyme [Streptomyces sp. E11-3]|uniref:maleylpyruvate isomerase family mycothiol-dependent enzyme n=1 Tax=Streptomyces sp. E11-3 TaxID=3110112 RepID=UPI0039809642
MTQDTRSDALPDVIDEIARSHARFAATATALTGADLRGPSALPGWTRGHVIAHVARGADAYTWLLALARTGVEPRPRDTAESLARAVESGAARPAAELVADLRTSLNRLLADSEAMPATAWDTLVTALPGYRHPAWFTLYRCWRELETHHVDLDADYGTANWPHTYVTWALDGTLAALSERDFPVSRVRAIDLGRSWNLSQNGPTVSADGHTLLGWLSGRTTDTALAADGPVPQPPAWPLPPTPAWS